MNHKTGINGRPKQQIPYFINNSCSYVASIETVLANVFFIKFRTIYTFSVYGKKKKEKKTSVEGE